MKLAPLLTTGFLVAASPAVADTVAPEPTEAAAAPTSAGRVLHRAASCGADYRGAVRLDFRRSDDGVGAGSVRVARGKQGKAELAPGSYDVRIYVYQRKAFRYLTTRHLKVSGDRWLAELGCAPGSKQPALQLVAPPTRVAAGR